MSVLKLAGLALGALVVVGLAATLVGALLPQTHRAACAASFAAAPADVFAALTDVAAFPAWHPGVRSARALPPLDGKPAFEETTCDGTVRYVVEESAPPTRLVVRIVDDGLPYGGTWTYALAPDGAGTRVTVTEDGRVDPPLFRLLARFVLGHHATLEAHLAALGRHLGTAVTVERVTAEHE